MSFKFINKISIILLIILTFSCQNSLISLDSKNKIDNTSSIKNVEKNDKIDLSFNSKLNNAAIDFYTIKEVNYNFKSKELKKFKINNYEGKIENKLPLNIIYTESGIYSINSKSNILKFNSKTKKLIERFSIDGYTKDKIPISFSFVNNDFIVGFKSGEVIRINKEGKIIWQYKNTNLLNTPIFHYDNNLIILYSDEIVVLSSTNGQIILEKKYTSSNIIQSSGGKIENYFNLIFFILPNSEFNVLDTFLYEDHFTNLNNIEVGNSLNNLNDKIHIYKNLFVYLDNKNTIHTFDLKNDEFILTKFIINNSNSSILFNNALISQNEKNIEFFNIKNGKLFSSINIEKIFKKESKLVKAISINNKLHLFNDDGILIIINKDFQIEKKIDLKIKKIMNIYSHNNKIFISSEKGITYIF